MKLEPFKLERFFAQHEFTAKHLLSCSDSESMPLGKLLDMAPDYRKDLEKLWLGYSESMGLPELRQEIAKTYSKVTADQVLLHAGAQEPILNLLNSVLGPEDHVIVHFPCYQSFYSIPRGIGCEVGFWNARFENDWKPDLGELSRLIRPNTRLVIANFPHNPTGAVLGQDEFMSLVEMLRHRGITLLSDEVYRGLEIRPEDRLPAACDLYEGAVSLGGMSKSYGLAGLRIGWVATQDRAILKSMAQYKDYTTICNPVIAETLAILAMKNGNKIISRNLEIVRKNLNELDRFFERWSKHFEWVRPRGSTMAFPRAKPHLDMTLFASRLLGEKGVMLLTGRHFDMEDQYFRLGMGRVAFPEALREMEKLLQG